MTAGSNPITLKKGIDKTCDFLVKKLKEVARPVKGTDDIRVRRALWSRCFCCPCVIHVIILLYLPVRPVAKACWLPRRMWPPFRQAMTP